jgi:hypothetical protein
MRNLIFFLIFTLAIGFLSGCAGKPKHHKQDLPDPKGFNAHFPDMDRDGDELVNWTEFKEYFPQAEQNVFNAVDLNADGNLDHDEWHEFKEAHDLMHKE